MNGIQNQIDCHKIVLFYFTQRLASLWLPKWLEQFIWHRYMQQIFEMKDEFANM